MKKISKHKSKSSIRFFPTTDHRPLVLKCSKNTWLKNDYCRVQIRSVLSSMQQTIAADAIDVIAFKLQRCASLFVADISFYERVRSIRTDDPRSLLYRHVSLCTVASSFTICRRGNVSVCTCTILVHVHTRAHTGERTRKDVPYARKARARSFRWPFPELTVLIGRREFRHKIPEFTSSRQQSRVCSDTRSISLLYGRCSVWQCVT